MCYYHERLLTDSDKVLVPTPTPVFTGASGSLTRGNSALVAVAAAIFAMLMM